MICCYYTKILKINTVMQTRAKFQFCHLNENISISPFMGENYLLFPAPMSQVVVNLNYLQHSVAFADYIFRTPRADCECFLIM